MQPLECYKEYVALKNHFTQKGYDYIKYNGKTRVKIEGFNARRDRFFFQKLAKHEDPKGFIIANLLENEKSWIGDIAYNERAQTCYLEWVKKIQSITYQFKNDMSSLMPSFNDNFITEDNNHPFVLKLFLRKDISLETLVILVDMTGCFKHWNKCMKDDPVWDSISLKIVKYRPFLNYDVDKIKSIVVDKFEE